MKLQLATARLGVLLTAEALAAGGHLLHTPLLEEVWRQAQRAPPSPPLQATHSSLQTTSSVGSMERD
jgi:hypothetical protein